MGGRREPEEGAGLQVGVWGLKTQLQLNSRPPAGGCQDPPVLQKPRGLLKGPAQV